MRFTSLNVFKTNLDFSTILIAIFKFRVFWGSFVAVYLIFQFIILLRDFNLFCSYLSVFSCWLISVGKLVNLRVNISYPNSYFILHIYLNIYFNISFFLPPYLFPSDVNRIPAASKFHLWACGLPHQHHVNIPKVICNVLWWMLFTETTVSAWLCFFASPSRLFLPPMPLEILKAKFQCASYQPDVLQPTKFVGREKARTELHKNTQNGMV
jgi:hypothetical protein